MLEYIHYFSGRIHKKLLTRVRKGSRTTSQGERKLVRRETDGSLVVTSTRVANGGHFATPSLLPHIPTLPFQAQWGRYFRDPSSPLLCAAFNTTLSVCPMALKTWGSSWPDAGRRAEGWRRQQGTEESHWGLTVGTCACTDSGEMHLYSRRIAPMGLNLKIHQPQVRKLSCSRSFPEGVMLSEPLTIGGK